MFEEFRSPLYSVILVVGQDACRENQKKTHGNAGEAVVLDKFFNNWYYLGRVFEHAFPDKHNPVSDESNGYHDWVTMFASPLTNELEEARKEFEAAEKLYFSPRRRAIGIYNFATKKYGSVDIQEKGHLSTLLTNTSKAFDTSSLRIEGQIKEEELLGLLKEVYPEEMERWKGRFKGNEFGF